MKGIKNAAIYSKINGLVRNIGKNEKSKRLFKDIKNLIFIFGFTFLFLILWVNRVNLSPENVILYTKGKFCSFGVGQGFPYTFDGTKIATENLKVHDGNIFALSDTSFEIINSSGKLVRKVKLESITVPAEMDKSRVVCGTEFEANTNILENLTGSLKPNGEIVVELSYAVQNSDVLDKATLVNEVTAGATDVTEVTDDATIDVKQIKTATIEKTATKVNGADVTADTKVVVGDVVTYVIKVQNTGNTTLIRTELTDSRDVKVN